MTFELGMGLKVKLQRVKQQSIIMYEHAVLSQPYQVAQV